MSKSYFWKFETEHFYFDVYRAWTAHGQAMYRAGVYIKKSSDRKYLIDFSLFAEWDYRNEQEAFAQAKSWLIEYTALLTKELEGLKNE